MVFLMLSQNTKQTVGIFIAGKIAMMVPGISIGIISNAPFPSKSAYFRRNQLDSGDVQTQSVCRSGGLLGETYTAEI